MTISVFIGYKCLSTCAGAPILISQIGIYLGNFKRRLSALFEVLQKKVSFSKFNFSKMLLLEFNLHLGKRKTYFV